MNDKDLRERALELRGFIRGYIAGKDSRLAPHTEATLTFLDDFLRADPGPKPSDNPGVLPVAVSILVAEASPEASLEPAPDNGQPRSIPPVVEAKSDEAKIEAFLNAKTQGEAPTPPPSGKKRKAWSPEAREAARERMRAMHAARGIKRREDDDPSPDAPRPVILKQGKASSPAPEPSSFHSGAEPDDRNGPATAPISSPADRWQPEPLSDDDWPDIQELLAQGRSRDAIASDFDVSVEYLDGFIAERLREAQERRAAKGAASGEA